MDFYENSFYNHKTKWLYKISPSILYSQKITAGERYAFSFFLKSNNAFNFNEYIPLKIPHDLVVGILHIYANYLINEFASYKKSYRSLRKRGVFLMRK